MVDGVSEDGARCLLLARHALLLQLEPQSEDELRILERYAAQLCGSRWDQFIGELRRLQHLSWLRNEEGEKTLGWRCMGTRCRETGYLCECSATRAPESQDNEEA